MQLSRKPNEQLHFTSSKQFNLQNKEHMCRQCGPLWLSRYLNVTDGRTDRPLAMAIPRSA